MKISALMNVNLVKKISKIIPLIILFAIFGFFIAGNVNAQSFTPPNRTNADSTYPQANTNLQNVDPNVELNMNNGMQILVIEFLSAISCQLTGINPASDSGKCLGFNSETGKIGFVESGGLLGFSTNLIKHTLVLPISSTQYISHMKDNFRTTGTAYAGDPAGTIECAVGADSNRGVGFCSLRPILDLWITMRNITYLILVLIFVVIGIGIMLRIHIDPRTVMTIQNQIPKIIIGIILITMSYAIAGFMVDIMWVATYLFASVITVATTPAGQAVDLSGLLQMVNSGTVFEAANQITYTPGGVFQEGIFLSGPLNMADQIGSAFASLIESIITGGRGENIFTQIFGGVVHIIAFIVIAIALLVALLRTWFSLVMAFINVLLDVIFAPFWLLAGVLPGSSAMSAWFRDIAANLAVFPVVIVFILFASYFVNAFSPPVGNPDGLPASYIAFPLLGGVNASSVAALIGLGFLLMLPTLLGQVKQFFKAPKLNFGNMMDPIRVGMGGPGRLVGGARSYVGGNKYELTDTGTQKVGRWTRAGRAWGVIK